MVAVPEGSAAVVRFVEPGAAAQQLDDPPSPPPYPVRKGGQGQHQERCGSLKKFFSACGARDSTANHQPLLNDKDTVAYLNPTDKG
jgi:hypothetical protein